MSTRITCITCITPTLADFEAWVLKKRRTAMNRLNAGGTTGQALDALLAECSKFNDTFQSLLDFSDDNDAASTTTPATSANKKA